MPTHRRTTPATLLAALLLTGMLAASGCGESNGTPAAATSTPTAPGSTTASSATSASTTATSTVPGASATKSAAPGSPQAGAHTTGAGRKKAHLVLPAPGSHPAPKLSSSEQAALPVSDISLSSPAIIRIGNSARYTIAREYTCHGSDRSLPLHWSAVPANTKELALFAISTRPVAGKLYYDWALAGIDPKLTGLQAGEQPPGSIPGQNSAGHTGYTLCPPAGQETYVFSLYAIPDSLHPQPGFDPATFRAQARETVRHTGLLVGTYAG
jgi:phosphatidylethanolamine-binding protein (PEBP) family uncharacterized protein